MLAFQCSSYFGPFVWFLVALKLCIRGGLLGVLWEPHCRRQIRQQPYINKIKYFFFI